MIQITYSVFIKILPTNQPQNIQKRCQ